MDKRLALLSHWAVEQAQDLTKQQNNCADLTFQPELEMVSGDASFRRYYRLHSLNDQQGLSQSWICVDAPPEKEDNQKFISIAKHWSEYNIAVPHVFAFDLQNGFMLLQDFGDQMLYPLLLDHKAADYYQQSLSALIGIQKLPTEQLPQYDLALLKTEMALFPDWLCGNKLQLNLSPSEQKMFDQAFQLLADNAVAQPQVVVHRDYHCRNIMIKPDQQIGIIDFQDAVIGAITYDAVSLLKDCYIKWPRQQVLIWLEQYYLQLIEQQLLTGDIDFALFTRWFDLMGIQRHLKAAGIFARLELRDGKTGYLADIPRTCQYLLENTALYPELSDLHLWLKDIFLPALAQKLPAYNAEEDDASQGMLDNKKEADLA